MDEEHEEHEDRENGDKSVSLMNYRHNNIKPSIMHVQSLGIPRAIAKYSCFDN